MIVYCEECGCKNTIDATRFQEANLQIPCSNCGDNLRFYGLKAKTLDRPQARAAGVPRTSLILKYGDRVVVVGETNTRVEIGRQKRNDIKVAHSRVSRSHAFIEFKNGKYYLTDRSSNGTYLLMQGRQGVTVRKKEVLLTARGVIGPGYKVDFSSANAIHMQFGHPADVSHPTFAQV